MLIGDDSRILSDLLLFRVHRTTKMMAIIGIIIYAAAILCRLSYGLPNYNKVNIFTSFLSVQRKKLLRQINIIIENVDAKKRERKIHFMFISMPNPFSTKIYQHSHA